MIEYLPILLLLIVAAGFAVFNLIITHIFGPRKPSPSKLSVYESGVAPIGGARLRFSIKFYLIAMLFIIFDVEIVFLYPWAVVFRDFLEGGLTIFIEMVVFLAILLLGYIYAWKKGGLTWE